MGFDHRREKVGRGRARGADQSHRPAGRLGHSQRQEAGASLVELQMAADGGVFVKGDHEWGRAGAGCQADVAQAGRGQRVDQRARPDDGGVFFAIA